MLVSLPNTIKLKNLTNSQKTNWKCIRKISTTFKFINSLAVSLDNQLIAVASNSATTVFNLQSGKRIYTFFGQLGEVFAVAISPNNRIITSGGFDSKLTSWRLDNKQFLHSYFERVLSLKLGNNTSHLGAIEAITYSPDGQLLASASADQTIKIWYGATGECKTTLKGHAGSVVCLAMSSDGKILASGSTDGTIRIWDLISYRQIRILSDNTFKVNAIAISPNNQILASIGTDPGVKLWDIHSGEQIANLIGDVSASKSIAISPDGMLLANSRLDNRVEIWNLTTQKLMATLAGSSPVAFTHDDKMLVTGGIEGNIKIWRLTNNSDELVCEDSTGKKWHEILSVDVTANYREVKRAYLRLARQYHPDLNQSYHAKLQMQLINRAYEKFKQTRT